MPDDPKEWDEHCQRRPSPETLKADNDAALDTALSDLDHARRRIAEYRRALAPFARLEAPQGWDDDMWMHQYVRTGDVREARRVMGEGGK